MRIHNRILKVLFFVIAFNSDIYSQNSNRPEVHTSLTFFYVDNSSSFKEAKINPEVVKKLNSLLSSANLKQDNYFLFYDCNSESVDITNSVNEVIESKWVNKYINGSVIESEYAIDKQIIREYISDNPVLIKSYIDVYIFLSSYAVKRMFENLDEMPTPLVFPYELANSLTDHQVKVKVNVYLNDEIKNKYSDEEINNLFGFCNEELELTKIQPYINYN